MKPPPAERIGQVVDSWTLEVFDVRLGDRFRLTSGMYSAIVMVEMIADDGHVTFCVQGKEPFPAGPLAKTEECRWTRIT